MNDMERVISALIEQADYTVIGYVDGAGFPVSRAMLPPREHDGFREFWFTTNTSSNKVKCLRETPQASVYFFDPQRFLGVCLTGTVQVLETSEAKERIWRPGDTLYYSKGVTDPDYCVLRFTARAGRFYCNFHSEDFTV